MQIESMKLKQFVDAFFERPQSHIYTRPEISFLLANKTDVWDIVGWPGAVAIYRNSQFKNMDEGYGEATPILVIHKKPECMNRTL
ncbi:hypothetical protein SAMN04487895_1273 [Paenibacillus sophorae]|uniref:Uncharacterized protein n=1 Tax=Paenibacillus sophorae TaxID=1333845 RepID=A0A1H8VR51_9BACL|nr:hypothetical protein [Paenibacillus sophorae]QWU15660.1 hypothetical protein KP014_28225 [Paenibacillus sophorae]SEP17804.1 hypothetical protein SAMN04487895_1273 [Paenibacillus sophorae]